MSNPALLLEVRGLSKSYPGVRALDNVDFDVMRGEVHCLAGENGAGKSTLIEIIGGSYKKDSGTICISGKEVTLKSPQHAQQCGIAVLHQELPVLKHLSVAENIFLGRQPRNKLGFVDYREMNRQAEKWLEMIDSKIDPRALMNGLSISKQQLVSIAKAISLQAEIIIFDEPSAVLTDQELERLFQIISLFRSEGKGIVYISHRLEEIFEIADRVTVLRNGKLVGTELTSTLTHEGLVKMIVGHQVSEEYISNKEPLHGPQPSLVISKLSRNGVLTDINFEVSRGEIFGIYGLVGSGRTEVARAIIGADPIDSGNIFFDSKKIENHTPWQAVRNGFCLIPEDRKSQGLFLEKPIIDNIALPALPQLTSGVLIDNKKMIDYSTELIRKLKITASHPRQYVKFLSGGNQQKVILAKWLGLKLKVYIFDEPTRGVDIGAKEEIRNLIRSIAQVDGIVILISSEISEIMTMADKIGVMHEGKMTAIIERAQATREKLISYSMGYKNL